MGILNVAALAGAIFLAVPILIHLIHRQRYPRVRFSTLRFFDRTRKHNVIQRRLIDIILLILRVAALAALVLGLARPIFSRGQGARTSVAIVLDNSASMAAIAAGTQSAFDLARAKALEIIATLRQRDRACLVLTVPQPDVLYTADKAALKAKVNELAGCEIVLRTQSGKGCVLTPGTDPRPVLAAIDALPPDELAAVAPVRPYHQRLSTDLADVKRRIEECGIAWQSGSLDASAAYAAGLLQKAGDARSHLFVISDFADIKGRAAKAPLLPPEASRVQLHLVAAANPAPKNIAIENVTLARDEVHPGEPLKLTVGLRNCTKTDSGPITLSIDVPGDNAIVSREPGIPAGKARSVDLHISTFARDNFKSGSARIDCPGDTYAADDVFYFTVPIRPTARVLCVNGVKATQPAGRETFYLLNALSPKAPGASDQAVTGIDVRSCEVDALADEILFQYDVTILANVPALDKKMRQRLAAYLRDGRSLLVFLGDQCDPGESNAWGFIPGSLGEKRQGEFVVLSEIDYDNSFLHPFADPAYGDLRAFGAYGYVTLDLSGDRDAQVLANFQNGQPALVEKKVGGGRVIICTTSCHSVWSKWPLVPAFVPFAQHLVKYLASPEHSPVAARGYTTGDSLLAGVEESFRAGTSVAYRQKLDNGRQRLMPVCLERSRPGTVVRVLETDVPGNYIVAENPAGQAAEAGKIGLGARLFGFSVNVDRAESDLSPVSNKDLAAALQAGTAEVVLLPLPAGEIAGDAVAIARGGTELWWYLLVLMAGLVVAESIVAWRTVSKT